MFIRSKLLAVVTGAAVTVTIPLAGGVSVAARSSAPADPREVKVLTQSVTDSAFTIVWNKPDEYDSIVDYAVTVSGGGSSRTYYASQNSSAASADIAQFYKEGVGDLLAGSGGSVAQKARQISMHTFCLSGLKPETTYRVTVQSVDQKGGRSDGDRVIQRTRTAAAQRVVNIEIMGAVGDGVRADDADDTASTGTSNTRAIQAAIDACPQNGTVLVPAGKIFVTGPLTLHSDMTLDVEGTLLASMDLSEYANPYDTDKTQVKQKSSPLISTAATGTGGKTLSYRNIRIVGQGTIDGNGWKTGTLKKDGTHPETLPIDTQFTQYMAGKESGGDASTLQQAADNHLAYRQYAKYLAAGEGADDAYGTRSNLIVISNASKVYVGDGLTVTNPSQHTIGFTGCKDAVVNNLTVSTYDCNNGDGINFTNSTGLTVVNSVFNTGDDCVNFNAGLGLSDESNPPTGGAWVFDNYFGRGHGVIAAGSNTAAWIQNILAEDNVCNGTAVGLRCKSQSGNGGGARNITFRDSALANITDNDGSAFLLTDAYKDAAGQDTSNWAPDEPTFHDLLIENCTVAGNKKGKPSISFNGAVDGYDYNITMRDVAFGWSSAGNGLTAASLAYLKNSVFDNVVFYGLSSPWPADMTTVQNCRFTGSTVAPD